MSGILHVRMDAGLMRLTLPAAPDNALGAALVGELGAAIARADGDRDCRAVAIAARGPSFCPGFAFAEMAAGASPRFAPFAELLSAIARTRLPVIALVDGEACGGGVGLAAACDLVIATARATFSLPEVIVGLVPAVITPFLRRRLPLARVRALALGSRSLGAVEAHAVGLVDEVAEGEAEAALARQVQRLFRSSPEAVAAAKGYFERLGASDLERELAAGLALADGWMARPGVADAIRAVADGFAPPWFHKWRAT